MNCGNSWVVCTACLKAFKGKRNSSTRHFNTIHKEVINTISQRMSTTNELSQQNMNDINMMTTFDNDNDQSITSLVSTKDNNHMCNLQRLENAEMTMNGSAVTTDEGTEVDFKMVVNIQGTLAQFGARLINDVSAQLMDQFVDNFKKLLSGAEVDNSLKAGSMMGSVVKGLFKK